MGPVVKKNMSKTYIFFKKMPVRVVHQWEGTGRRPKLTIKPASSDLTVGRPNPQVP